MMILEHATVLTPEKLAGITQWRDELEAAGAEINAQMIDDALTELERLDGQIGAGGPAPGAQQPGPSAPYSKSDLTVALMHALAGTGQVDTNNAGTLMELVSGVVESVFGEES